MSGVQTFYDPRSQFTGTEGGKYAISAWLGAWASEPYTKPIDPWNERHTLAIPGAKLINHSSIPIHKPGVGGWRGKFEFDETSGKFLQANRSLFQKGTKANLFNVANFDLGHFSKAPGTMSVELGNVAPLMFVAMLNGCFGGSPVTKAGAAPENHELVILRDQVYDGSIAVLPSASLPAWVASTSYVVGQKVKNGGNIYRCITDGTSAGSGGPSTTASDITDNTAHWKYLFSQSMQNAKPVNPAFPEFMEGSEWTNCHEQLEINPDNITEVIVNQQQRLAMNGVELGIGDEGIEILVAASNKEQMRQLLEVFRQLPGTGAYGTTPAQVPITGGTTSQVVYSVQDNPVFGRAKVRAVTGMRSDLWVVSSPPPAGMPPANHVLFVHTLGGSAGEWKIQEDPEAMGGDNVPHISVFQFPAGTNSSMFTGAMPGTTAGDIGISMLLAEGFATGTGVLFDFCFTGYAS